MVSSLCNVFLLIPKTNYTLSTAPRHPVQWAFVYVLKRPGLSN